MPTHDEAVATLRDLIDDIRIGMLTTVTDGTLRSRPMAKQAMATDGDLWFFTRDDSDKWAEIGRNPHVNVAFAEPADENYVSVSGRAQLVHDRAKAEELWQPLLKAWFPDGLDDPHLALIRVEVDHAEYWSAPSSAVVQIVGFAKALVTGTPYHAGENEKVDL